jgi:hypothetical protein
MRRKRRFRFDRRGVPASALQLLMRRGMTNFSIAPDLLATVIGGAGASSTPDATAVAKRASDLKPGKSQLDLYGYHTSNSNGVGAEVLHRFNENVSVFANGTVGNRDDKPDASVMGGIRFQW